MTKTVATVHTHTQVNLINKSNVGAAYHAAQDKKISYLSRQGLFVKEIEQV